MNFVLNINSLHQRFTSVFEEFFLLFVLPNNVPTAGAHATLMDDT
jgi:hypothetical protein